MAKLFAAQETLYGLNFCDQFYVTIVLLLAASFTVLPLSPQTRKASQILLILVVSFFWKPPLISLAYSSIPL